MNVSFSREYRLDTLFWTLNLNTRNGSFNYAMIKAVDAGMKLVEKYFDEILGDVFFDSPQGYGAKMICDLLDLSDFDLENVKKYLSQGFVDYKYGELQKEYSNLNNTNMSISVSKFIISVTGEKANYLSQIIKLVPFLEMYLCPGVVPQANGVNYVFDELDAFDYNADDWDKIAKTSFNFIDSLGGI